MPLMDLPLAYRGAWAQHRWYASGDVTDVAGALYVCTHSLRSTTTPASDLRHWAVLGLAPEFSLEPVTDAGGNLLVDEEGSVVTAPALT